VVRVADAEAVGCVEARAADSVRVDLEAEVAAAVRVE